jgi:hypothetical protein
MRHQPIKRYFETSPLLVRVEATNLKTEDVVMCCQAKAYRTTQRAMIDVYEAMAE